MMKTIKLIIFLTLLFTSFFLNAQKIDTSQVVELKRKAKFFVNDLQRDSAIVYYKKIAAIYKFNKLWEQYFECSLNVTLNLALTNKPAEAREAIQIILKDSEQHIDEYGLKKARCYRQLAVLKVNDEKYKDALSLFDKALSFLKVNSKTVKLKLGILLGKSTAYGRLNYPTKGFKMINEGLSLYFERAKKLQIKISEI